MKKRILAAMILALISTHANADNLMDISASNNRITIESNTDRLVIKKITLNRGNCRGWDWQSVVDGNNWKVNKLKKELALLEEYYDRVYDLKSLLIHNNLNEEVPYIELMTYSDRRSLLTCQLSSCSYLDSILKKIEETEEKASRDYDKMSKEDKEYIEKRFANELDRELPRRLDMVESTKKEIAKINSQQPPTLGFGQSKTFSYSCGGGSLKEIEVEMDNGKKVTYSLSRR